MLLRGICNYLAPYQSIGSAAAAAAAAAEQRN